MTKRILYVQYTNPAGYPPLEHSSHILADRGWRVLFLGTGAAGADTLEFPSHPKVWVRRWKFQSAGFLQKLHYFAFNVWCIWRTLIWRPKWIYASDLMSCPAALLLKKFGFRVVYHEHDTPQERNAERLTTETLKLSGFQRFLLSVRQKVARSADICVIPNERRLENFKGSTGRNGPTFCVWNCPLREEAERQPQKASDKFIVFYHGSIVPSRLPLEVIDALALLPQSIHLEFAGYETVGHAGYVFELLSRAKFKRVAERVRYHGPIKYRSQLLALCRRAHVGLTLMPLNSDDANEQTMTGASNKPFDYLACGLAILVSDLRDWNDMFVKQSYAYSCDPVHVKGIAQALEWFVGNAKQVYAMGERGRERILSEWNYQVQFQPVIARLEHDE